MALCALALTSCASSVNYASGPKPLPPMPSFVQSEAKRSPTSLPEPAQKAKGSQELTKALRASELAYKRALDTALRNYERARAKLKKGSQQ